MSLRQNTHFLMSPIPDSLAIRNYGLVKKAISSHVKHHVSCNVCLSALLICLIHRGTLAKKNTMAPAKKSKVAENTVNCHILGQYDRQCYFSSYLASPSLPKLEPSPLSTAQATARHLSNSPRHGYSSC